MAEYLQSHPEQVPDLWDNSVEAFVDIAYSASNMPTLRDAALMEAVRNFRVIAHPYGQPTPEHHVCAEAGTLLSLVVYGRTLMDRTADAASLERLYTVLVAKANLAITDCGGLAGLLGYDPSEKLATPSTSNGDVYDLVMWAITLGDALANPALSLPAGSHRLIGDVWSYLAQYPLPSALDVPGGLNDSAVYDTAYLVTHAGYIPTGYGRYPLHRSDGEWLYIYLRENFYPAMAMGELDLLAEFVDLFRQYGCTEENDKQLRDGSRYLLKLYDKAGGSWMAHREPYEGKTVSPYDMLHKPWTGLAGLRRRVVEPVVPGTYGAVVRAAIIP